MRIEKMIVVVQRASPKPSLYAGISPSKTPAENGAGEVADAAEHGRGEGEEAEPEAEVELRRAEVERVDRARPRLRTPRRART